MAKSNEQSAAVQADQEAVRRAESHAEGLEHSQGGITTRHDAKDLGVPMLQGDPSEPAGPEDALGEGPKRGDYSDRVGPANYHPHEGEVPQRERASEQGEVPGKKGGVNSAEGR